MKNYTQFVNDDYRINLSHRPILDLGTFVIGCIRRWFTCPQTVTHTSSNHLIVSDPDRESNPRPLDRKSNNVLTVTPKSVCTFPVDGDGRAVRGGRCKWALINGSRSYQPLSRVRVGHIVTRCSHDHSAHTTSSASASSFYCAKARTNRS